jgi:hypothetical protein
MSSQQIWPVVAVLIPTFNRGELLNHNLKLLGQHLRYEGAVKVLVSDDSDNDDLAFIPEPETVESTFPIQYRRNKVSGSAWAQTLTSFTRWPGLNASTR